MKTIKTIKEMRDLSLKTRMSGKRIGFVPTMGGLHAGHLSLAKKAKEMTDFVVVSIFVNPTQFGPNEDFKKYPRDLKADLALLGPLDVDVVFAPSADEMFPGGMTAYVDVPGLSEGLCGRVRPGHFRGVATVVAKLFNIILPDLAFFGEKDYQQLAVIKKMIEDLNFNTKIVGLPTVREEGGLAMSSRNKNLSEEEKISAQALFSSLLLAEEMIGEGITSSARIITAMKKLIMSAWPKVKIDYIEVCDPSTLKKRSRLSGRTLVALAAFVGKTRLIDNIVVEVI